MKASAEDEEHWQGACISDENEDASDNGTACLQTSFTWGGLLSCLNFIWGMVSHCGAANLNYIICDNCVCWIRSNF